MADDLLFNHDTIHRALLLLAERLAHQPMERHTLIVVGGSYLALHELRDATRDIDAITRFDTALRTAIADIASEHNLPPHWLNDAAAAFRPEGLTLDDCTTILDHPALTVITPAPRWVFAMKLFASRAVDHPDLVRLWPSTGFTTADDAVRFYRNAYPAALDDPYLAGYVHTIANQ